jgi:hypothetical protein
MRRNQLPFEDREAIVATIQETYVLMGRAIQMRVPEERLEEFLDRAVRRDVVEELLETPLEYVTDEEFIEFFQRVYSELVENVFQIQDALLGEIGPELDGVLEQVGLAGSGRELKVGLFRRAIDRVRQFGSRRWVKSAFKLGNIVLGSLGPVPVVGIAAEPIKELKESIEAKREEDDGHD